MTCKSFPRPAAIASVLCFGWFATAAPAQTPPPAAHRVAHLRLLNLLPLNGGSVDLVTAGADAKAPPLKTAPPSNFYMGYFDQSPVRATFTLFRAGNRDAPIKSFDVPLKVDAYFTILAYLKPDGQPTADLLDETPDPTVPPSTRLTVRQFYRGAQIVVTANGGQKTDALPYGGTQTLQRLTEGVLPFTMAATVAAGGPPRMLNLEANFTQVRRETIYIVTDPYDRLRPRMTSDGPPRAEEDATIKARGPAAVPAM